MSKCKSVLESLVDENFPTAANLEPPHQAQRSLQLPSSSSLPEESSNSITQAGGSRQLSETKRVAILNQLILILHAYICQKRLQLAQNYASITQCSDSVDFTCKVAYCARMRSILDHIRQCQVADSEKCSVKSCLSTKQIIRHYQNCSDQECVVCKEVRQLPAFGLAKLNISSPSECCDSIHQAWHSDNYSQDQRQKLVDCMVKDLAKIAHIEEPEAEAYRDQLLVMEKQAFYHSTSAEAYLWKIADQTSAMGRNVRDRKKIGPE